VREEETTKRLHIGVFEHRCKGDYRGGPKDLYKRRRAGDAKMIGVDRVYFLGLGCSFILSVRLFSMEQIKTARGNKMQRVGIVV